MTEDEAKTKWCPMVNGNRDISGARISKEPGAGNIWNCCIGSNCMMWRYSHPEYIRRNEEDKQLSGFCGIAGRYKE